MAHQAIIAFLLTGLGFLAGPAVWARTLIVDGSGGDTSSIKCALGLAHAGDRILIKPGHYRETELIVEKPVEIIGENWPLIDGDGKHQIILIKANHVHITGLKVENTGISYSEDRAGIRLSNVEECVIERNVLSNDLFGIYLAHCKKCTIRNNCIRGNFHTEGSAGNGIHLWHCSDIQILSNQITGQRDGIYLEFVRTSLIAKNNSYANLRYGLHFMFSNNDSYCDNTFASNGAGVAVMYSNQVNMSSNVFTHNWGAASYGLLLKDINHAVIANNRFVQNTIGMQCDGTNHIIVHHNDFLENGKGIRISTYSSDTLFTSNNFIGNTFDLSSNAALNSVCFDKNYWGYYQGYDLDNDGVADAPYQPVSISCLLLDQYPAASVILRSPVLDLLDLVERALPALTPEALIDKSPLIRKVIWKTP